MCVIIAKAKGVKLPTKKFLQMAASVNRDGCGFATSSGVYFRSLDFDEFYEKFKDSVTKEDAVVIHFRWATHGSVAEKNCHPFEAEANDKKFWFAHNGVLPIESRDDMTDSEICLRKEIVPVLNNEGGFTKFFYEFCTHVAGSSKFAFVDDGGLHLVGQWEKHEGLFLSNKRFMWSGYVGGVGISSYSSTRRYASMR